MYLTAPEALCSVAISTFLICYTNGQDELREFTVPQYEVNREPYGCIYKLGILFVRVLIT